VCQSGDAQQATSEVAITRDKLAIDHKCLRRCMKVGSPWFQHVGPNTRSDRLRLFRRPTSTMPRRTSERCVEPPRAANPTHTSRGCCGFPTHGRQCGTGVSC
jgi:hypothetical protein